MKLTSLNKSFFFFLAFGLLLLLARLSLYQSSEPVIEIEEKVGEIEQKLFSLRKKYIELSQPELIQKYLLDKNQPRNYLDLVNQSGIDFYVYDNKELVFWSDHKTMPGIYLASALEEGTAFAKMGNAYYIFFKSSFNYRPKNGSHREVNVLGMLPFKYQYNIQNTYLNNHFNQAFNIPEYFELTEPESTSKLTVNGANGEPLFSLSINEFERKVNVDYSKLFWESLFFVWLLFLIYFLTRFFSRTNTFLGLLALSTMLVLLRYYMLIANWPVEWSKLELFNPQLYASSSFNRSLGDLALNFLFFFWMLLYLYRYMHFEVMKKWPQWLKFLVFFIAVSGLFGGSIVLVKILENLVLNSKIPLDFNNFLNLNGYSFIGLAIYASVLLGFILLLHKLVLLKSSLKIKNAYFSAALLFPFLIWVIYLTFQPESRLYLLAPAWCMALIYWFEKNRVLKNFGFTQLTILLVFSAFFSAIYLNVFTQQKSLQNSKAVARKLAEERDPVTEYLFSQAENEILEDPFVRSFFLKPFLSSKEISNRIKNLYFKGYFNKYEINIYLLNREGKLIQYGQNNYLDFLTKELNEYAELTESPYLFYIPKPSGNYLYIGNLPIIYRNKLLGSVVIELNPKTYSKTNLYPELLLDDKVKIKVSDDMQGYGVYSNNALINSYGNYAYNYRFSLPKYPDLEFYKLKDDERNVKHLIYNGARHKTVVITEPQESALQPISLFSYLFIIYLIFSVFLLLLYLLFRLSRRPEFLKERLNFSFRDKIQLAMIFMIVISFLFIGLITIMHFTNEYSSYHMDRLEQKENSISSSIEYIVKENEDILKEIDLRSKNLQLFGGAFDVSTLSDIHNMDINIYSLQGKLVNTSQPDIFKQRLLSSNMNPDAFHTLKNEQRSQVVLNEQIGTLNYLSIYVPVRNNQGVKKAYLNLPYFAKEKELNKNISSFLVTLINVYVLLLLLGAFMAYILADSITQGLGVISKQIKKIKLDKANEPISWKSKDEIGTLVAEYNKMLKELEASAELLAKSERESAWREMAKQIAHEIKNPLTPMKLSIQHLQRAMSENHPRAEEMAVKTSQTLIEQIDHLNYIASEFSSFAKMPRAEQAPLNIVEVIQSVVELFSENSGLQINVEKEKDYFEVIADKNQLNRAFTNLLKNAVQAMEDIREGKINIRLYAKDHQLMIEIEDNGSGIPEHLQDKVFVPNFTTKSSGTGLGLAMTRQIIENAGGKIWFESEEGTGTTFFIKFKLQSEHAA